MTAPSMPEVYAQEGWGAHEVGRSREPHNPVDDAQTKAFIDGWNARLDYDDFDKALHYWLLSGITHVGALPLAHPAASTPVTLYREIDALGGVSQGPWDDGYSAALTDVLLILMKRGFSEEQDIGAALPAHNINSYVDGYEDALEVAAHPAAPQGEESTQAECQIPPTGWYCTRKAGHEGPCAAIPDGGLEDEIADALDDSLDMDWTGKVGARAVMALLRAKRMVN